ncbi:hypothetical protein OBBRIDRAFT_705088, partial [Obba rivulosa]
INILWFSSLVLSLSAASIGISVRQWLNHFISSSSSNSKRSAYIHCLRYDKGLVPWHVPEILSALPILLQSALFLFLLGLLVLIWTFNEVVASITTALVALLFAFSAYTSVIPAFKPLCPYKAPHALL